MKNLLVIAFHYPPDNSSTGVLRTAKFVEYLLQHRWRAHVVTAPSQIYVEQNPLAEDLIPGEITVDRAWACDIKQMFGIGGVYPSWLSIPDRYWPWFFAARRAAIRAIATRGIEVIYSTYPLPTAHLIGLSLKLRFQLPWIADFRDPWATEGSSGVRANLEAWLERKVLTTADRVICNTPAMRRSFVERYPELGAEKFVTITNGYDEKDFVSISPIRAAKFHVFYSGNIDSENRNPAGLFAGVRLALDRGFLSADDLVITFLGSGAYASSQAFRNDLKRYALESVVDIVKERVPYREALARMAGADVVVVLSDNLAGSEGDAVIQKWTAMQVPAKLYEYLRVGRPMLALVCEGAVSELLRSTGTDVPLASRDADGISLALKAFYENRRLHSDKGIKAEYVNPDVRKYSRENLTTMLANELDALVTRKM